jgi:phosphate acyltransferase
VEGAVGALTSLGGSFRLVLVGDRERIEEELARYPDAPRDRIEIVHAPERIEMGESPAQAIRRKQDSSIVVGLNLHKQGEVDAFISAGSTGAVMAGSLVILRPLPGWTVRRSARCSPRGAGTSCCWMPAPTSTPARSTSSSSRTWAPSTRRT